MPVTIRDVASRAGASPAAVSATLNGKSRGSIRIGAQTRERILAAARELGYVPNPNAQGLATGKTGVIGLVLPYAEAFIDYNPFCSHAMHGVFEESIRRHYNLMLYTAWPEGGPSRPLGIERVDGLLLVLPQPGSPVVESARVRGIPAVGVVSPVLYEGFETVNADDYGGGRLAAQHLLALGHERFAHLAGSDLICTSAPRRQGFLDVLTEAGIPAEHRLVVPAGFDAVPGARAMNELLQLPEKERPTAVFAVNDMCANGAISACRQAHLSVPHDIAIVGYDDTRYAESTTPTLTSVRMNIELLARRAVGLLAEMLDGARATPSHPVLPVSLTVRASCGADRRERRSSRKRPTHSTTKEIL